MGNCSGCSKGNGMSRRRYNGSRGNGWSGRNGGGDNGSAASSFSQMDTANLNSFSNMRRYGPRVTGVADRSSWTLMDAQIGCLAKGTDYRTPRQLFKLYW